MLQPLTLQPSDPDFLQALNRRLADLATGIESVVPAATTPAIGPTVSTAAGTHKQRLAYPAAQLPVGSTWWETDRQVLYVVHGPGGETHQWRYHSGQMRGTLSPDQKPADLNNAGDVGFRFFSTDFMHTYRWNGSAWRYAVEDGDPGSAVIEWWAVSPNNNGIYQLCDGSTVTRSLNTGTTGSITTPNLIGKYPKGAAAYSGSVVAASTGTLSGATDSAGAHSHTTTISVTIAGSTGTTTVQSGSGASVASSIHTHPFGTSAGSDTQGAHTHTLTGVSVTGAEPAHVDLMPYMRL